MHHKVILATSFIAALGLMLWEAAPAGAAMIAPQSIRLIDAPSNAITPIRCKQAHCFTYEQYMRPGFNPKKERRWAGPGKEKNARQRAEDWSRKLQRCSFSFGGAC